MKQTVSSESEQTWLGQPRGLVILFLTELWERFSYYGMRGILVLFVYTAIKDNPFGGLGWTSKEAIELYKYYTMLVYLVSIPGGILADKFLGQKKSVILGGALLCMGHLVLAIHGELAFFTGLTLIILGVGGLKPNISTMVGGLYKQGDIRRDKGFTIFYIGINLGAFLAAITVPFVAEIYGWHYGFGLAGIGMLIGQITFMWGQKYLKGVGNFIGKPNSNAKKDYKRPLTKIEKDRIIVLALSFLIVIVFWGAFEQAGGLMNIYANDKVDRFISFINYEMPAAVFQSANPFFILVFGLIIASFWVKRRIKGKEESAIFKMAIGTMIMGLGFLAMGIASQESSAEAFGKASMIWLILAYLLHTIGELCVSPVALSFITKLSPVKYASIMMGIYFACTGMGNFVAGYIGESSQIEPIEVHLVHSNFDNFNEDTQKAIRDTTKSFEVKTNLYQNENGTLIINNFNNNKPLTESISFDNDNIKRVQSSLENTSQTAPYHAKIAFTLNDDKDLYVGRLTIEEIQNEIEFKTFIGILIFTIIAGILLLLFLKKLKALTHNAEDVSTS